MPLLVPFIKVTGAIIRQSVLPFACAIVKVYDRSDFSVRHVHAGCTSPSCIWNCLCRYGFSNEQRLFTGEVNQVCYVTEIGDVTQRVLRTECFLQVCQTRRTAFIRSHYVYWTRNILSSAHIRARAT